MNEKEVGVSVNHEMTMSYQCDADVKKTIVILKYIRQSIFHRDRELLMPFYKALVKLHLLHYMYSCPLMLKKVEPK